MNTENIFPIVIYPETKKIKFLIVILILIFLGFSFFINFIFIFFLPLINIIYHVIIKHKIKELHINGEKIKISNEGIILFKDNNPKIKYTWDEINDVEFYIKAFDETSILSRGGYTGNENYITLNTKSNQQIIFNFYIKNEWDFEKLVYVLKNDILPIVYSLQKVKYENIYFDKLNFNERQEFKEKYNISHYNGKIHYK